jgi:hypothetical protein
MDNYLRGLAKTLFELRHEAVTVPFRDCSNPNFQPVEQNCHDNVDHWCRLHPAQEPVRGWLVIEHPDRGYCRFVAHAVVRDPQDGLFDLTSGAAEHYPFLQHPHTGEEFVLLLSRSGLIHIDHRLRR